VSSLDAEEDERESRHRVDDHGDRTAKPHWCP
jgi:hypothetical protein